MRIYFILSLLLVSCTTTQTLRVPQSNLQSSLQANSDLLGDLKKMHGDIEGNTLNAGNCHIYLQNKLQLLAEENLQAYPATSDDKLALEQIMQQTWQIRQALHQRLTTLGACRTDLRQVFYRLRSIEDLADLAFYNVPQTQMPSVKDAEKLPIPLKDNAALHGYLGTSGQVETAPVEFRNGDLMLTRGGSYFSAILASITPYPGQIDHFVLVHQDAKGVTETVESYAQNVSVDQKPLPGGVTDYPIDFALKNQNARILLLRPKNAGIAASAADLMMAKATGTPKIPYDYAMNLDDPTHMNCAAITYWGFKNASKGALVLPEERSELDPRLTQIYDSIKMKERSIMTAQDVELDSRFDMILEYRDHALVQDTRFREAVEQSVVRWMEQDNYWIQPSFDSFVINVVVFPFNLKSMFDIPPDAPKNFVKISKQINDLSDVLYKRLAEANDKFKKTTGWNMTQNQMLLALENYRKQDYDKCLNYTGDAAELHQLFSPVVCRNQRQE